MLVNLVLAIVVLVYAALQTDLNRKCKKKNVVADSQVNMLQYTNITMLIVASAAVLYFSYHLFVPSSYKTLATNYF